MACGAGSRVLNAEVVFFYLLLKKMWHLLDIQSFLLVEFLLDVSGVITSNYHPFVKNFKHLFSFLSIFSCDLCIFCCLDFSPIPTQTTSRSHQHMHRNQTLRRAIRAPGCFATEAAYRYKMLRPWKEFLGWKVVKKIGIWAWSLNKRPAISWGFKPWQPRRVGHWKIPMMKSFLVS